MSSTLSKRLAYPSPIHLCRRAASARGSRLANVKRRCGSVEHVEVLDGFVDLPVLEVADAMPVVPSSSTRTNACRKCRCSGVGSSAKGLIVTPCCRAQARGSARRAASPASGSCGRRPVRRSAARALRVRDQEVQEALAAARRAEHQRVTDVLHMQVEGVRVRCGRLEDGQRLLVQVRTDGVAVIEREQETQVREVGFEGETAKVVRAVSWNDAQPGV